MSTNKYKWFIIGSVGIELSLFQLRNEMLIVLGFFLHFSIDTIYMQVIFLNTRPAKTPPSLCTNLKLWLPMRDFWDAGGRRHISPFFEALSMRAYAQYRTRRSEHAQNCEKGPSKSLPLESCSSLQPTSAIRCIHDWPLAKAAITAIGARKLLGQLSSNDRFLFNLMLSELVTPLQGGILKF